VAEIQSIVVRAPRVPSISWRGT